MKMKVKVYNDVKYKAVSEKITEIEYDNVKGFDVVSDPSTVEEIEAHTSGDCIDDNHEYLVLYFENGETSTFRNSYVDLFRV